MCIGKKGYEGEGIKRYAWWSQEAVENQLQETLEEAREASSMRLRGRKACSGNQGTKYAEWEVGMMGQRQATTGWVNGIMC